MDNWLLLVAVSIIAWGSYVALSKIVTNKDYFGIEPGAASILMLAGIIITFALFFAIRPSRIPSEPKLIALGILVGAIWAVGQIFSFIVLSQGADVARIAPLYNINGLIAVLLGIILLGEVPAADQMIKVVAGAILIIIGGILVAF